MNTSAVHLHCEVPRTPFKFLHYYEETDAASFAGRDREVIEIADAALGAPALVLYGKSGLGKTSLLLAGVFPELRRRGCIPLHVRTLQNPIRDLSREVLRATYAEEIPTARGAPIGLDELRVALKTLTAERPAILVLDQFEEFFIRFRGQQAIYDGFVKAIGALVNDRELRVHVVFSLREEYLADLDDFRSHMPHLFENEYRLRPLTAFGVREAIARPLTLSNIPFDPRLVTQLVDRVSQERFDCVVLQILCQEVFEHAQARRAGEFRLSKADLAQVQDINAVFRRYLDETAEALPHDLHLHVRVVLHSLTTQERTKRALRLEDFSSGAYHLSEDELLRVLTNLERHKLVRVDQRGDERWYELTHERLAPIVETWLRLDREFNALVAAYDLIATPSRSGVWREVPQHLLPPGFLTDVVGPFRARLALSDLEVEFLAWSALFHHHEDVEFWGKRFGKNKARALIFDKLDSTDPRFRRGAALAAGRILEADEEAAQRIQKLSLDDPDPEIRREAGRALVRLRTDETDALLRKALQSRVTQERAIETLADLAAAGVALRTFRLRDRWRVRKIVNKRTLEAQGQAISEAVRAGVQGANYGAMAWLLGVALVYSTLTGFFVSATANSSKLEVIRDCLGASLVTAIVFGILPSRFIAKGIATRLALTRQQNLGRALWQSPLFLCVPLAWVIFIATGPRILRDYTKLEFLLFSGLPIVYWLSIPMLVRFAQKATRRGSELRHVLASTLASSAGLPVLFPGAVLLLGFQMANGAPRKPFSIAMGMSLFAIPILSGITACLGSCLLWLWASQSERLCPEAPLEPRTNRGAAIWRALLLLLAPLPLAIVFYLVGFGIFPIPWTTNTWGTDSKRIIVESPSAGPAQRTVPRVSYRYFSVSANQDKQVLTTLHLSKDCDPGPQLDGLRITKSQMVLLGQGRHEVAFAQRKNQCALTLNHSMDISSQSVEFRGGVNKRNGAGWVTVPGGITTTGSKPSSDVIQNSNMETQITGTAAPNSRVYLTFQRSLELVVPDQGARIFAGEDADAEPWGKLTCQGVIPLSLSVSVVTRSPGLADAIAVDPPTRGNTCVVTATTSGDWRVSVRLDLPSTPKMGTDKYRVLVRQVSNSDIPEFSIDEADRQARNAAFHSLREEKGAGKDYLGWDFSRADLASSDFADADLQRVVADFADFSNSVLSRAKLGRASLDFANLTGANLTGAQFNGAHLRNCRFDGARLSSRQTEAPTDFDGADLSGSDLSGLLPRDAVTYARFRDATLSYANLSGLDLRGFDFQNATLTNACLGHVDANKLARLTNGQLKQACGTGAITRGSERISMKPCKVPPKWTGAVPLGACTAAPRSRKSDSISLCRKIVTPKLEPSNLLSWTAADRIDTCSCSLDARLPLRDNTTPEENSYE